ncbi:MAG TPA: nitroreductase [Syntrophorhabdales bacterium]|nr:nitroreductase [Syntrophorhabdales bacterium]
MDVLEAMESRTSRRAFLRKQVDQGTLERIVKSANRSPSYMNTQPWELYVVGGKVKDALAGKLSSDITNGVPLVPDIPFPTVWPVDHEERFKHHRLRRFRALGIDPDKQQDEVIAAYRNNFKFFDAPCVIFVAMDRTLTPWSIFDCGSFVNGFLLAAHAEGLGGCPQAVPTGYADAIRTELAIPGHLMIVLCISLGYPDPASPVNQYHSLRRELAEFVHWYGFSER